MTARVLAIVGPTASGKTAVALDLAERIGGEIVNADSMQLYAGMDIGTAKTPPGERRGIPHHLLDVWSPLQEASVAAYQEMARTVVEEILARDRTAVLVGGSGLYVRAVLDDLEFPGTDLAIRDRLSAELADLGVAALHGRLATLDPAAAAAILASNDRRVVRALEVIELTGRPFSATMPTFDAERWGAVQLGLDPELAVLDASIDGRVGEMWSQGLVAETTRLRTDPGLGPTASKALGYAQVARMLDGAIDEAEARRDTAQATRRFSRRQRSWFRRDPRISWFPTAADLLAGFTRMAV